MSSRFALVPVIYGHPATGLGALRAITGCLAHGSWRRLVCCGLLAIGLGATVFMSGMLATGLHRSASTVASSMALATLASATRAATGVTEHFSTTVR